MDTMLTIAVGLGLSAASGFRAFVPMLVMSLAARSGHLTLAPGMEWVASDAALAVIIGGGTAGIIQGSTVVLRLASSAMTGGLGNPFLATAELLGAITVAVLATLAPLIALGMVVVLVTIAVRKAGRAVRARRARAA